MPDVQSSIEAKLQADPSIDAVVTLGAPFADTAVKAKQSAGSYAEIDTFDLNAKVATALQRRHPRLRRRPAALPPGVRGGRPALALQVQRATSSAAGSRS